MSKKSKKVFKKCIFLIGLIDITFQNTFQNQKGQSMTSFSLIFLIPAHYITTKIVMCNSLRCVHCT